MRPTLLLDVPERGWDCEIAADADIDQSFFSVTGFAAEAVEDNRWLCLKKLMAFVGLDWLCRKNSKTNSPRSKMAFNNFCTTFINHFVDETDPATRFERVARLMVEEITKPGAHLTYAVDLDAAILNLRAALRPVLMQEGLLCIEPAFFGGGISAEDTELLLEEFALFVEDPDGYEEPDLEEDEEEDDQEQPVG